MERRIETKFRRGDPAGRPFYLPGGRRAGAGAAMARNLPHANFVTERWKGWDFCLRSNRKNRDSAQGFKRKSQSTTTRNGA